VFLGLASFYILSEYTERGILQPGKSAIKDQQLEFVAEKK
jgi:hypothetical protein